jgi:hypothetical protein
VFTCWEHVHTLKIDHAARFSVVRHIPTFPWCAADHTAADQFPDLNLGRKDLQAHTVMFDLPLANKSHNSSKLMRYCSPHVENGA